MTIEEYLASDFSGKPTTGDIGKESQWLDFCQLTVREGKVHVVDASYAADPVEGCMIELAPGSYQAQAKIMAYGRDTRISRLRVVRPGVAATDCLTGWRYWDRYWEHRNLRLRSIREGLGLG